METSDEYPVALKPGELQKLLKDYVPDERHSYFDPSVLSTVISWIKGRKLLSETCEESTKEEILENWKSTIDAWDDRLMILLSNSMPDKCWAGVCLIGLTCQECSSNRFLASYSGWFQKLQTHMQEPTTQVVKVASCASLADLLMRLGKFPKLKKDGSNLARKLIEPLLELLHEERTEAILDGAIRLLFAVLISFPSAIHHHYDNIEAAIASKVLLGTYSDTPSPLIEAATASKVLSGIGSVGLSMFIQFLAILPKSRGDEGSWCLLMQKILLSIDGHLNDAFRGLEGSTNDEVFRLLVPPGKQPPPTLGEGDAIVKCMKRSEQMLISSVTRLMLCCREMLMYSYPVQITVPIRSLLTLVERIVMVDGSVPRNLSLFVTAQQQELLSLHFFALELLGALIKAMRSQILPHAPYIVQLITRYFKKCTLPELRIKVYSVIRILLASMGIGVAIFLGQEVVDGASMDLNPEIGTGNAFGNFQLNENKVSLSPNHRKRKRAPVSTEDKHEISGLAPKDRQTVPSTVKVKIASLKALEALLRVALKSESWRSKVDKLLIFVATNVMDEGCFNENSRSCIPDVPATLREKLQLAALSALWVSLLSRGDCPPHIAKSLELFQKGRQQTGTRVAELCARAVLSIEVLIHPRTLPLNNYSTIPQDSFERPSRKLLVDGHINSVRQKNALSSGRQRQGFGLSDSDDDELHKLHLQNGIGDNLEMNSNLIGETADKAEKLSNEIPLVKDDSGKAEMALSAVDDVGAAGHKEIMIDSLQHEDTSGGDQKSLPDQSIMIPCTNKSTEKLSEMDASAEEVKYADANLQLDGHAVGSDTNVIDNFSAGSKGKLRPDVSGKLLIDSDDESSMDVFPDIVDADPDTDED